MFYLAAFVLGSIWGSFCNVCIYRLPDNESVVTKRSFCRSCKNKIKWRFPFVRWWFLHHILSKKIKTRNPYLWTVRNLGAIPSYRGLKWYQPMRIFEIFLLRRVPGCQETILIAIRSTLQTNIFPKTKNKWKIITKSVKTRSPELSLVGNESPRQSPRRARFFLCVFLCFFVCVCFCVFSSFFFF